NGRQVILVSKDALVRVKADVIGLYAEDFLSDRVIEHDEIYSGFSELLVPGQILNDFYVQKELPISSILEKPPFPNQFIILKSLDSSSSSAIGMVDPFLGKVKKLIFDKEHVWGIRPRNVQQIMALELL